METPILRQLAHIELNRVVSGSNRDECGVRCPVFSVRLGTTRCPVFGSFYRVPGARIPRFSPGTGPRAVPGTSLVAGWRWPPLLVPRRARTASK